MTTHTKKQASDIISRWWRYSNEPYAKDLLIKMLEEELDSVWLAGIEAERALKRFEELSKDLYDNKRF